jgi:hypothetical protein
MPILLVSFKNHNVRAYLSHSLEIGGSLHAVSDSNQLDNR